MTDELDPDELQPQEDLARKEELNDLKLVMSSKQGRRLMYRILYDFALVEHIGFAGEQTHLTSFNAGSRNVGLKLLTELREACGTQIRIMEDEASSLDKE